MTALAVDAQTRKLAWTGLQFQVIQGQPPDLTHAQAAIQHQAEHGTVARIGDGGEQSYQVNVGNVTRQMLAEAGGVQARPNRVGRRVVGFQGQEVVEDAQAGEAAIERGAGMAEAFTVGDIAGYVLGRDSGRLLAGPGEEELEIAEVMLGGGGVRTAGAQPGGEPIQLGGHARLL